ncbi:MAG TPA: ABC transporter permease subunit, partial [Rugosimonospora sp.]|nr:ABC transporter permease subunit [Rugosimonospora sp.]
MVAQTARPGQVTEPAPAAPRRRRAYGARVAAAVGIALLIPLTIVPLGYLLYGSVLDTEQVTQAGRATFVHFTDLLADHEFWTDLGHSLSLALASGIASTVIGVTIAWIVVQVRPPGSAVIDALMLFSFFMSSFVAAVAYVLLGNPSNGLVNLWLGKVVGHPVSVVNVQSFWGIVFALTVAGVPFVYMLTSAALAGADPALEEAAAMSGARRWRRLRTVTFPLVLPGILTGVFFSLVFSLEAFVEPAILGAPIEYDTLTTRIYHTIISFPPRYGTSSALAVLLMVILVLLIFLQRRLLGERSFTSFTGKTGSAVPVTASFRRRTRWLLGLIPLAYLIVAVGLPYYALVQISLQPFVSPTVTRLSFHNYAAFFDDPNSGTSLRNALYACLIGIAASLVWM